MAGSAPRAAGRRHCLLGRVGIGPGDMVSETPVELTLEELRHLDATYTPIPSFSAVVGRAPVDQ